MFGRFAPSPSGSLHLGNLRTALAAWLAARLSGRGFIIRMEDLDPAVCTRAHAEAQLSALAALGLDAEPGVMYQSERQARYVEVIETLRDRGLVYPCFCSRREIAAAVSAPHGQVVAPVGAGAGGAGFGGGVLDLVVEKPYPGTCRSLTDAERRVRLDSGRPAALRLRAERLALQVNDELVGPIRAFVDDMVLQRADGVAAYNLAVVVDDAEQQVSQVVRGDDLLASTPRQVYLQRLLGYPTPEYLHVPLVMDADGVRLAKRTGGVTLEGLAESGVGPLVVLRSLGRSLGVPGAETVGSAAELLDGARRAGYTLRDAPRTPLPLGEL